MDCEEVSTQWLIYICCTIVLGERSTGEIKTSKLNNIKNQPNKNPTQTKPFLSVNLRPPKQHPRAPGKALQIVWRCSDQEGLSPKPCSAGFELLTSGCHCSKTYRSTDGARGQEVSRSEIAAVDGMMSQLLFHGPVHVLEEGGRGAKARKQQRTFPGGPLGCAEWSHGLAYGTHKPTL